MADNNDDQYLDELLNSLRSSNSDGNEDLDNLDSESDKSRQADNADDEVVDNGGNTEQDDFLNDIFSDNHNDGDNQDGNANQDGSDDIFALEENGNEEPHESENSMDEENVTSQNDSSDNDSLMDLFNQINGGDNSGSNDSSDEEENNKSNDNAADDILTLPDDNENEAASNTYSGEAEEKADTQNEGSATDNSGQQDVKPSREEKAEAEKSARAEKAEAAREAKEAKLAAAKAAKEAKAEEKARKKAEKKAKKEQLKAEKAAGKNKQDGEDDSTGDIAQDNVALIDELYNDSNAFNESSEENADNHDLDEEPEAPKKKKEKKKKEPKPKKPKKEKVKKEKKAPQPSELIKVTKGNYIGMLITIIVIVGIVYFGTSFVSYGIKVSQAKEFFTNGKYDQAFDSISGVELRDSDKNTYYAIRTVASVYVDYCSYISYNKIGMKLEALDSLIKGLTHYNEYYSDAEKYEVIDQYDAVKNQILTELSNYGISEEDAIYYGSLENELQYREILMDIGGMTE